MSVKLSKKDLKETGIAHEAFYLGGNVYAYENAIFYLGIRDIEKLQKSSFKGNDIENLIEYLKKYNMEEIHIMTRQLFYSAGEYGNNGQLHKVDILDRKTSEKLDTIYVYYC